jgi:hypothetical protein
MKENFGEQKEEKKDKPLRRRMHVLLVMKHCDLIEKKKEITDETFEKEVDNFLMDSELQRLMTAYSFAESDVRPIFDEEIEKFKKELAEKAEEFKRYKMREKR